MKNGIWLFIIAVAAFLVFLPSYSHVQDLREKNLNYDLRIKELKKEQIELKEEVRRLREDPVHLERIAREKMGLIKEGEVIYRIVDPEE